MQIRAGNRRIFDKDLDADEVVRVAEEFSVSMVILEAIDELWRRNSVKHRKTCRRLFQQYAESRQADLDDELAALEKDYQLNEDEGKPDTTKQARAEVAQIAARIRHARVDQKLLGRLLEGGAELQTESPLMLFGYSVSAARNLSQRARAELLEDFWNLGDVPAALFPADYRAGWGAQSSRKRKERMKSHLEFLAEFFERNDSARYELAVRKWRKDAAFIHAL